MLYNRLQSPYNRQNPAVAEVKTGLNKWTHRIQSGMAIICSSGRESSIRNTEISLKIALFYESCGVNSRPSTTERLLHQHLTMFGFRLVRVLTLRLMKFTSCWTKAYPHHSPVCFVPRPVRSVVRTSCVKQKQQNYTSDWRAACTNVQCARRKKKALWW